MLIALLFVPCPPCPLFQVIVDVSGGCGAKFELYLSSNQFTGMKLLDRHRLVNGLLAPLMDRIHAVTIKAWTPQEFEKNKAQVPQQ